MGYLLGIDLGTSSVKAMLLETESGESFVEAISYSVDVPKAGWAEQNPEMWWDSLKTVLHSLKEKHPDAFEHILSIGFSGQMHGLVLIDENGKPLRPAIIALDQRSGDQVADIYENVSFDELKTVFHNRPSTGFAFPSLLWVRDNEAEILAKTDKVFQPKDYLRYKITNCIGCDYTDASSTLAFDMENHDWAWDIFDRFHIPHEIFPTCNESTAIAGTVTENCSKETGLPVGIPIVFGCGDQQAQSIGNGVIQEGTFVSNIGTSGQISTFKNNDAYDPELRTHTFCHAFDHAYTLYGAVLCSGMSLNWLKNKILHLDSYDQLTNLAQQVPAGSEGVIYLPYLSGERTPHINHQACGEFFGLHLANDRSHFIRAVMEGVVFSLKNSLDIFKDINMKPTLLIASGGGARSPLWLQIQADIFECEVLLCDTNEQACLGASILAGVGIGIYSSVSEACAKFVKLKPEIYYPNPKNFDVYRERYKLYNQLYVATKDLMTN